MDTIPRVKDLTKRYGTKTALDNVNFSIKRGRIYGFIGENGAGKTTTIRAITGLSGTEKGNIELFGSTSEEGIQKGRRKIGYLVENPILSMNDTAEENLRMQMLLYGKRDEAKIKRLLKRVGLENTGRKTAKDFSLGMKQRLGIDVDVHIPDSAILINADKRDISRALSNLIVNTYKHNPSGITLYVRMEREGDMCSITLADTGNAIPQGMDIFEPFVTENSARTSGCGTGLGLAITKRVIERHGGSISLTHNIPGYTKAFIVKLKCR